MLTEKEAHDLGVQEESGTHQLRLDQFKEIFKDGNERLQRAFNAGRNEVLDQNLGRPGSPYYN